MTQEKDADAARQGSSVGGAAKNAAGKAAEAAEKAAASVNAVWMESQHKDLMFYLVVAIFMLELVVGGVAFFYGLIHAVPDPQGGPPKFQFPWLAYVLAAVLAPAALLLIVHLAGVGLFRSMEKDKDRDEAWRQDLPERLRKVYAIIQGAPTVVLLVGLMLLGAALFYIDGAMTALFRLGKAAEVHLPWIIGGVVLVWCVGFGGRTWLRYRNKRLEEEYAFRREVFEKTGMVIVERGAMQLPPAMAENVQVLPAGDNGRNGALPPGVTPAGDGPLLDVTPEDAGSAGNGTSTGADSGGNAEQAGGKQPGTPVQPEVMPEK